MEFNMQSLRRIAVALGDYDVATCNCHHTALVLYNSCAQARERVSRMPNEFLTCSARLFRLLGMKVAQSRTVDSKSTGHSSEVVGSGKRVDSECRLTEFSAQNLRGRELQKSICPSKWCVTPDQFREFMRKVHSEYPGIDQDLELNMNVDIHIEI